MIWGCLDKKCMIFICKTEKTKIKRQILVRRGIRILQVFCLSVVSRLLSICAKSDSPLYIRGVLPDMYFNLSGVLDKNF